MGIFPASVEKIHFSINMFGKNQVYVKQMISFGDLMSLNN